MRKAKIIILYLLTINEKFYMISFLFHGHGNFLLSSDFYEGDSE